MRAAKDAAAGEISEADAIRRAQQGDPSAFETLYRLHSRRVYALCLRMAGNVSEAEDLTQETFFTIFRKIQGFRGESAFSTWLHRVTVNTVLMRFRKKKVAEDSLDETSDPEDEDIKAPLELGGRDLRLSGVIDRVNLQRALNQLSPGCKVMFVLHDVQGYRHDEIAEIAGCSVGNSKSQLHKARMRLREILRDELRGGRKRRTPAPILRKGSRLVTAPASHALMTGNGYDLAFGDA
ncbi:MAG: RNA polymerase sigma factor [Candidatus Acidiferrales bacterium]